MKTIDKVLEKMCDMVGAKKENIDFRDPDWYTLFTWTQSMEAEFKEWFIDLLMNDKLARKEIMNYSVKDKKMIKRAADEFVFNFGWTTE